MTAFWSSNYFLQGGSEPEAVEDVELRRSGREGMRLLKNVLLKNVLSVGAVVVVLLSIRASARAQGDPGRWFDAQTAAVRKPGTTVRIDLIGDSTQTDHAGYGRGFCANLTAKVDCVNMARGGASTRSYREQGLWDHALATRPNYMVIQFGHNDLVTSQHLARQVPLADYAANLKRFVTEARAAGIKPVLVTPVTRRYFGSDGKIHSDLTEYCDAMRGVAHEMHVPLIDLQNESIAYLDKVGEAEGDKLGITKKDADGKTVFEQTHLDWQGSYVFGRMVAVGLGKSAPALRKYVRPKAAELPPEGVKEMGILNGAPVKIVLVGDSTVATEGGWGPGFCADMTANVTCVDDALNGRSTKSFIDEGAWDKALAEHGDYYLIQFGHNDQKPDAARHTDPETTYAANLERYIHDAEKIGAVPVILSPLARRTFRDGKPSNADLELYANAARRVAEQNNVTFIDLLSISDAVLSTMTQAEADEFDAAGHADQHAENGAAPLDRTHLDGYGKKFFGRIVADNIVRTQVELGPDVIGTPVAQHPALFLAGDSIMHTGSGSGDTGPWGWGSEMIPMFDETKIHVYNDGLGGRSSRGYIEEAAWQKITSQLQPGDWVIVQFGHNDGANSQNYPDRTTLKGDSDATGQIESPVTHQQETIHSYGWYLRQYVTDAKAKGATVIICSPPPRNQWLEGRVVRGLDGYASWAADAARVSGARFIDLNTITASKYDALGQEAAKAYFFDFQHSRKIGAKLNAESVAEGLRGLKDCPLADDLLPAVH
jgi:lysophospholipase L1-like esterase